MLYLWCAYSSICTFIGSSVVIVGKVPAISTAQWAAHACKFGSWNGNGNLQRVSVVGGACTLQ